MKNNVDYHITEFDGYNKNFESLIRSNTNPKIYLLDIELSNSISGIDIARFIRKYDWNSVVILVTSHNELGYDALKAQIMLLDFVSKYDNCEENLDKTIKKAISLVGDKKVLKFSSCGYSYIVHIEDIVYVLKDTIDRKCIIKTTYNDISINRTMTYMINELDHRFYLSHRSCLVNTDKIVKIDWKNNIIFFNTGDQIDLISRDRRKGLKQYVAS